MMEMIAAILPSSVADPHGGSGWRQIPPEIMSCRNPPLPATYEKGSKGKGADALQTTRPIEGGMDKSACGDGSAQPTSWPR